MTTVTIVEQRNAVTVEEGVVHVTPVEQETAVTVALGGVTDHGALSGLADDDHAQYLTTARHAAIGSNPHGVTAVDVGALPLSGGTMTGKITLDGDPAAALHAATKQYVDASAGGASDVGDLTTDAGNAGEMVRVAAAGGLEYRTAAQVLADIGAAGADDLDDYLPLAGGTLTGNLDIGATSDADVGVIMQGEKTLIHSFQHPTGGTAVPIGKNLFVGPNAGNFTMGSTASSQFDASHNVGVGVEALMALTTGQYNMAIGAAALWKNQSGSFNVAIGGSALFNLVGTDGTVAIGYQAGFASTTGTRNVAIGYRAGVALTTGGNNTIIGYRAMTGVVTGNWNTAIGDSAAGLNTSGHSNTAIGESALLQNTTGARNVAIGRQAGRYQADGSTSLIPNNSIYIGYQAYGLDNSDNNSVVIGYDTRGLGANTTVIGSANTTLARLYGTLEGWRRTAATNAITNIGQLTHNSSGTPAAGFGAGLLFGLESSTTEDTTAARIAAVWTEATHATRKADLVLSAYDTAEREGLRIRATGSAAAIGFLGATPVARPEVTGSAGGNAALASLLTALANLGLITDSST